MEVREGREVFGQRGGVHLLRLKGEPDLTTHENGARATDDADMAVAATIPVVYPLAAPSFLTRRPRAAGVR